LTNPATRLHGLSSFLRDGAPTRGLGKRAMDYYRIDGADTIDQPQLELKSIRLMPRHRPHYRRVIG
jgi:hypothetical protein